MNFLLVENTIFLGYAPKVSTDLLWWLTYIFTAIAIFYFGFSFFFKRKLNFGIKSTKAKKKELTQIISQFLFVDENATLEEKQEYLNLKIRIREILKTKKNRKILAEVIVELRQDLSGDSLEVLIGLYKDLGLHKDAYAKLYNWKWFTVSQGIFELTRMKVDDSYGKITKFINDRRSIIRKQAELSVVTLHNEGINYFLDTTDKNISEWQQLKMLDILIKKQDFNPPSFKNWLASKNTDTVLFCIRLIKYYNQFEAGSAILKLIRHKDATIRSESVICAKEFRLIDAAETLKSVFLTSTDDCKLLIVDTLESFGREEDVEFLQLLKSSKEAFAIKNKASSAINNINPNTEIDTKNLEDVSNDYLTQLLNNQEEEEVEKDSSVENEELDNEQTINSIPEEIQIATQNELEPQEIDTLEEINITEDEVLPIDTNIEELKDLDVEIDNKEVTASSELLNFVAEEVQEDTQDLEIDSKPEEEEKIKLDIDDKVAIDDIKHIEFIEYMSTKSVSETENETESESESESEINDEESPFEEVFFNKSHYEKFNLLEEIKESGDKNEIPLLEAIIAEEKNKNIKEKARNIYWQIAKNHTKLEQFESEIKHVSESVILPAQTVFNDLYYSCDTEAKLILLEEIGALGDSIELKFLTEELSAKNEEIRKKAAKIIAVIENRLGTVDNDSHQNNTIVPETDKSNIIAELIDKNQKRTDNDYNHDNEELIPLEYCFLLDKLEIKPSKESDDLDINFDISDEYFLPR